MSNISLFNHYDLPPDKQVRKAYHELLTRYPQPPPITQSHQIIKAEHSLWSLSHRVTDLVLRKAQSIDNLSSRCIK